MNSALEWAKANVFIIVFVLVMIAALVTLPLIASGMNQKVREEVQSRAQRLSEFQQLERTQINWPGSEETRQGVVNREFIDQYRQLVQSARDDAEQVFQAALERNRADHELLMPELFPAPPRGEREILPARFHERLVNAYNELIAEVGAGGPPAAEDVKREVELRREQFIGQILARDEGDRLSEEEQEHLRRQLAELRMLQYQDAASALRLYMPREVLGIPEWNQQNIPNLAELFERQWRFWIHRDVLRALADANGEGQSLLRSPVKRVVRFDFIDAPVASSEGGGSGRSGRGGGGISGGGGGIVGGGGGAMSGGGGAISGGGGAAGRGSGGGGMGMDSDEPLGPVAINHSAEAPRDYTSSFTGRRTNQLYDVRHVELELIVDTARMPEVFEALARRNFMTVIGVQLAPADPYEDARDGYYYGAEPVSRLTIQVETIWMRSWTAQYMPGSTRAALGIQSKPAPPGM